MLSPPVSKGNEQIVSVTVGKEVYMDMNTSQSVRGTIQPKRKPDCVTEVRVGGTVLTVSGFLKWDASETAADKMAKVIETEGILEAFPLKEVS